MAGDVDGSFHFPLDDERLVAANFAGYCDLPAENGLGSGNLGFD
jgi:hypothetical protein